MADEARWRVTAAARAVDERLEARVEEHESVARAQRDHVRERLDQRDPVAELRELGAGAVYGAGSLVDALVDVAGREPK